MYCKMPRKQARQSQKKRLWFNVVEFDKATGRPLWRNKKSKLENTLAPCITDPKFTALLDKLRRETAANAWNVKNETTVVESSTPSATVWRLNKYNLNPRANPVKAETTSSLQNNSCGRSCHDDETSPKLVMQFQRFSPLAETKPVYATKEVQSKRQIQDLLKMKSAQASSAYQPFDNAQSYTAKENTIKRDVPCAVTSNCTLTSEWGMNNTVRLHHLDIETPPNHGMTTLNKQVALTIY